MSGDIERVRFLGRVGITTVDEAGTHFETGVPVRFRFVRNTEPSPNFGARYGQDIEPTGRYMLHPSLSGAPPRGWQEGQVAFESPLVLTFNATPGEVYGPKDWKHRLTEASGGRKGRRLSDFLRSLGFDAVVTVRDGETSEIVDLVQRPQGGRRG